MPGKTLTEFRIQLQHQSSALKTAGIHLQQHKCMVLINSQNLINIT